MYEAEKNRGFRNEGKRRWRRLQTILSMITLILSILLYCSLLPTFHRSWSINSIPKDSAGHLKAVNSDSASIPLHPDIQAHRPPKTVQLTWTITKGIRRPDGVAKQVYLINGEFPGPTVEVRSGDELIVTVRNRLEDAESVAIHWHGLHVPNDMDGVIGLTQCGIGRGAGFTYRLRIADDQAGTFWYHSHSDTQRADGLYGILVVHEPAQAKAKNTLYDNDQALMIGDFYHRSARDVVAEYMHWKSFKIEPAPDSLLMNGKGFFRCSMAVPARPVDCKPVEVPYLVLAARRTRLRIVNTGSLTGFSVSATGYLMTVVEVDGGNDVGHSRSAKTVEILYPGERIDVLIERVDTAEAESGSIIIALDQENMRFPNMALTATQQFQVLTTTSESVVNGGNVLGHETDGSDKDTIDLSTLTGREVSIPARSDETLVLYCTISYLAINDNRPKGFVNHTSWSLDPDSANALPLLALPRAEWPSNPAPFVPSVSASSWVELVINNIDRDKGHPFHLHGNDFYVLATHAASRVGAYELYNPFDTSKKPAGGPLNTHNPLKKDTVYIPSMGYAVLRVKADNPGLWLLHCHILWHQAIGMAMALQTGNIEDEGFNSVKDAARASYK